MSSKKKRKSPCSFASSKKPSKSKAFEFIRYKVRTGRKLKKRQRRTCRPGLTRVMVEHLLPAIAGKKISWNQFLARFVMQRWLCWRMFPQAPCLVHLRSCPVKTSIAPRGIWAKISLLTLLNERRNSDLAKDIFHQEQRLNRLCNRYELYC